MLRMIALTAAALLLSGQAVADNAGPVTMTLHGVRSGQGMIRCSLFDNSEAFPSQHELALARVHVRAHKGDVVCVFPAARPGVYAIAGFHDENESGKLDMGLFGPKEGWFASRDARARLAPPSFEHAQITHPGGPLSLSATFVY